MSVDKALRIARESGGLNAYHVPHLHPKKIREPRAEKFVKHLNAQHTGPIHSSVAGRTDHLPMHVPSAAYVLPAGFRERSLAEGNTMAGFAHARGSLEEHHVEVASNHTITRAALWHGEGGNRGVRS